ncbi:MAG: hypothetical protein LUQ50_00280 [Methanospirillum sp.]|uniref:hypothetical protein n=1 Tax=Methanospirillum sp. TaxID=45200 RepID=UPI002371E1E4|nr:hypothetical protein [Methanospirillum sp.]MDD1727487.1 hypothetical protein [Methanospirillum sp.]
MWGRDKKNWHFAMVLLMVLGMTRIDGVAAARNAEAVPEGLNQQDLIQWCETRLLEKDDIGEVRNPE